MALLLLEWLKLDNRCFVDFGDALFFFKRRFGLVCDTYVIYFATLGVRPFRGIKALDSHYVRR